MSQLLDATAINKDYDKVVAIATAIQREMTQQREWSSAPAATSTAVLPASVMHATGIASSTPATTAES
eukprot:5700031-Pleurochrysis_carterae.AAC.1